VTQVVVSQYLCYTRLAKLEANLALAKSNTCHIGGGSKGGQFCTTSGSGGGGGAAASVPQSSSTSFVGPPPVTELETRALTAYKGMGYVAMNQHLLGKSGGSEVQQNVEHMAAVIDRSNITKDMVLYRGIGNKRGASLASLPVGTEYSIPVFQSTSMNHQTAVTFASGGLKGGKPVNKTPVLLEDQSSERHQRSGTRTVHSARV